MTGKLGSSRAGAPVDTRGAVEGDGLVLRNGVYVNERVMGVDGNLPLWVDFTPDWTSSGTAPSLGNGTLEGRYVHIGTTVTFSIQLTWGSTTTGGTGTWRITLPVTASNTTNAFAARVLEGGVDNDVAVGVSATTTYMEFVAEGTNVVSATTPFTWGDADVLNVSGSYEVDINNGGSTLLSGYSPILDSKPTTDTLDDEFDSTTLDGKWTAVTGAIGTVDLLETGEVEKYDLTTRPGWLLMQAGSAADQKVELRQDLTLADGDSVIAAISIVVSSDDNTGLLSNELRVGLCLNDNDTGWDAGEYNQLALTVQDDGWRLIHFDGTTIHGSTSTGASIDASPVAELIYFRFVRVGSVLHAFWSTDGTSWMALGSETRSATATNIWLFMESIAPAGEPVPIVAVDWIRQGSNNLDPWPHSGLVTVAQVEDWTAFTPTLDASTTAPTIGDGTLDAKYRRTGTSVEIYIRWQFGSTSAAGSGTYEFNSLPYPIVTGDPGHQGSALIIDNSLGNYFHGTCVQGGADRITMGFVYDGSAPHALLGHSNTITWATSDKLTVYMAYETDFS